MRRLDVNRRKPLRVLLSLAVAAIILGAYAGPAAAARPAVAGTCEFIRTLCLWEGTGYTGERFTVSALNPTVGTCVSLVEHGWGDRARSGINTNSRGAELYMNEGCIGRPLVLFGSSPDLGISAKSVYVY